MKTFLKYTIFLILVSFTWHACIIPTDDGIDDSDTIDIFDDGVIVDDSSDDDNLPADLDLQGTWSRNDGLHIFIVENKGYFHSSYLGSQWQPFFNVGLIQHSSLKLKNIIRIDYNTWVCEELWRHSINDEPSQVAYSPATIEMNNAGTQITIESVDPFGTTSHSRTYVLE